MSTRRRRTCKTAAAHAAGTGLTIDYRAATAEMLAEEGAQFDVVLNMEVVEHVADLAGTCAPVRDCWRPAAVMIVATLNRTLQEVALAKIGAEYILRWLPARHP